MSPLEKILNSLRSLERLQAPDGLEPRVARTFEEGARLERVADALHGLERPEAPDSLAGFVVAACNAGQRQDRASAAVSSLARLETPAELEGSVLTPEGHAPAVLERLVREELADPAKATSRRHAGSLERMRAPAELRERLAEARPRNRRWLALAAALVAALFLWRHAGRVEQGTEPQLAQVYSFEVRRAGSLDELGSAALDLADGLGGGLLLAEKYRADAPDAAEGAGR